MTFTLLLIQQAPPTPYPLTMIPLQSVNFSVPNTAAWTIKVKRLMKIKYEKGGGKMHRKSQDFNWVLIGNYLGVQMSVWPLCPKKVPHPHQIHNILWSLAYPRSPVIVHVIGHPRTPSTLLAPSGLLRLQTTGYTTWVSILSKKKALKCS